MVPLILILIAFGMALTYAVVINGWREAVARELARPRIATDPGSVPVTVAMIVPSRDAATTIQPLLQDLYAQHYDKSHVSVIVVDDASSDATGELVRSMMTRWPQLKLVLNEGVGKKAAITTGVHTVNAEWILLTDADGRCGPGRLPALMDHVRHTSSDLVLMPVATDGTSLLGALQENEQAALMMCAAGTALQGDPMLANGANIAFRRSAFLEVRGYEGDRFASGDDIFLVQRMRAAGKRISYLLDARVIVRVEAENTWADFYHQRLRWAGKMRGVSWKDKWISALGLLFPWMLFAVTFSIDWPSVVGQRFYMNALLIAGAWVIWLAAVPPLVRDGQSFIGQRYSAIASVFSFAAFSLYAPVLSMLSFFWASTWRGRRL